MPEPDPNEVQAYFKNAFATPQGRIVLGEILTLGHFGEIFNASDPEHAMRIGEYNLAITIARMAGALDPIYPQLGIPVKEN